MLDINIIVETLEMTNDMNRFFLDMETMETVCLSDLDSSLMVETATLIDEHPDRFIALPTRRQINEYGMMEDFINQLPDGETKRSLGIAIQGKGAFRRFKDTAYQFGIQDDWFAFRDAAYHRVARRWCEENDIEYMQKVKMPIDDEGLKSLLSDFLDDGDDGDNDDDDGDGDEPFHFVKINADEIRKNPEALREMLSDMIDEGPDEETTPDNISTVALLEAIRILNRTLSREELDAAIVRIQNKIENGN